MTKYYICIKKCSIGVALPCYRKYTSASDYSKYIWSCYHKRYTNINEDTISNLCSDMWKEITKEELDAEIMLEVL
jgi:hypothetical protein